MIRPRLKIVFYSGAPRSGTKSRNGEGTIVRRKDGRFAGAATVTRPDGSRGRKWVYGRSRAEAAEKLLATISRERCGEALSIDCPTLDAYLSYWLMEVVGPCLRPTTTAKYRTAVELYLRPGLGPCRIDLLTVAHLQKFLNGRLRGGDSAQKVRWIREVLSSALGRAVREDLVHRNVAQLVSIPAVPPRRRIAWNACQARYFLDASAGDAAHPVFVLALLYGLRRGELAALRWCDVDNAGGTLTVGTSLVRVDGRLVLGPPKSRAGYRSLPLVDVARRALREQRSRQEQQRETAGMKWRETGFVFTTRTGQPADPHNLSRSFDRIVATCGLPRITFHDMRRTATTLFKDLGVPARDAQVILGHSHVSVTLGIYSEVFDSRLDWAMERMDRALSNTVDADTSSAVGPDRAQH